jgi:hypothetical protein
MPVVIVNDVLPESTPGYRHNKIKSSFKLLISEQNFSKIIPIQII